MAVDEESRALLKGLVARIDMAECVARVQRSIEEMAEYQGFVEGRTQLDDRGPAGIRWNLEAFLRWAVDDGAAPRPQELARLRELIGVRAAEGRPPEEGLAVYRRAMRAGWEVVLEAADERERAALGGAFDLLLEWLEIVSQVFEHAYAEERDALVSQHERRARRLLELILTEDEPGADGQRLADALGFRLAGRYRPFVAALAAARPAPARPAASSAQPAASPAQPAAPAAQLLQLAAHLRGPDVLAVSEGQRVVGLAHLPLDLARLAAGERLLLVQGEPHERGSLGETFADLRTVVALAVAAGQRGVIDPDAWLPELLLARSPWLAQRLHTRVFGPLLAVGRPDLADTLRALAASGFERSAAAAALPVHRNTLLQRVARIEQLTALDLDDPADRGTIWLASRAPAGPF
ncbi:CdaR family transcriptional regulator [Conexibacter sp. CPCC 206217]|uniref:PucR family transcriptional regulator n=1 Tax=Conexibacter sp. CPCC 206217 TaxID=3064574 RepID=UPI0027216861|nr:helix-turn-helix domain-containing protein [Conexibacter sp. CPCC 206217]MDO8212371.1 helix-turn-helix domain-containing protein [Conexibacter sp. CPCC 206217]